MELNKWINNNYSRLYTAAKNITKNHQETDEFFQCCILQILEKPDKIKQLDDKSKIYFFIRVLQNNWNSNTSKYQYQRLKHLKLNLPLDDERAELIPDNEYTEDIPDMAWVYNELEDFHWYDRDLFMLWVELGTFTKVSQETTIPLNSVGKYIKETMCELKTRWKNQNKYI